ncbi:YggT family protein [Chloroflexus sp.]|uniref:YggT family protein n=1 Tax=Chloroflexus sp. TaxID=1904827 RepID=UPI002ADDECA5|nr:YggT family protein [Chloroflexus sp.]
MNRRLVDLLQEGIALLGGALGGLLVVRLVLKLLAARPDSPAVTWLYNLTDPIVAALAMMDRDQPRFGSILELSTLATLVLIVSLTALIWVGLGRMQRQ